MTNRITGTNSGIDVDEVVKASLSTEQNRIDKAYQEQKVVEYQQAQLKEIVDSAASFYDKYLDILSSDSLLKSNAYASVGFTPTNTSDTSVSMTGFAGAEIDNYTVQITQLAQKASTTLKGNDLNDKIASDGVIIFEMGEGESKVELKVDVQYNDKGEIDMELTAQALNTELKNKNIEVTAKYSQFSKGIVIESNNTGESSKFNVSVASGVTSTSTIDKSDIVIAESVQGKNAKGLITKSNGDTYEVDLEENKLTLDNIQFNFNSVNATQEGDKIVGGTTLLGKNDTAKLKETIINFINDYNTLMETINGKLWETRDTDYMPLTDEQKAEMSDSEIEKWEEKAQTGLLRSDNDLKRIQSAMKSAMSSFMSDTGMSLESIGIKPVDNYTTKNGMFTIDEETLTKALEENADGIKDLFTRSSSDSDKGGVLTQLQSVLKSEVKSSSSSLSKKIGFAGTATESNNTYSTKITKQKKLIAELQEKYTTKETALYNKYSNLEVMLEKLNSQSNALYSMLGIS